VIFVREEVRQDFPETTVAGFMAIDSETVKHVVADRRTSHFYRNGRHYYMKAHHGIGWGEILKNLVTFKLPVLGARSEWQAIRALERLGVATMRIAAYGETGFNPAAIQSFLVTDALEQTEDLEQWLPGLDLARPADVRLKRAIIARMAKVARILHGNGLNHRDFYLCHFRIDLSEGKPVEDNLRLYLMDLHRMQQRHKTPERWAVKDVAGLIYSAFNVRGRPLFSRTDIARFIRAYESSDFGSACRSHRKFWQQVTARIRGFARRKQYSRAELPSWLK